MRLKIKDHRPEDLITKVSPVDYDPSAQCPTFDKYLSQVMGGNMALISFLQRALGYTLTGSTKEHVIFFLVGIGRNGKTTFLEIIGMTFGNGYWKTADSSLLLATRGEGPRNDVARLDGVRFISTSESSAEAKLDEAFVKRFTGGDTMAVRFLFKEATEYRPVGKLWAGTNKKPKISGRDKAIWSRIILVPFNVTIPQEEQDKDLLQKLAQERAGILAFMVRGMPGLPEARVEPSSRGTRRNEGVWLESNELGEFLADCCFIDVKDQSLATPFSQLTNADQETSNSAEKKPPAKAVIGPIDEDLANKL